MKNYTITVNGNVYEVTVEEGFTGKASAPAAGSITVSAPMPGKILGVKTSVGAAVKKGQVILILEAMKMENEIVAPEDGTVASVNVSVGEMVEPGATLATLN